MIYVHVGFPKVASTTIQRFLSRNAAFLDKHGLVYPRLTAPGKAQLGVGLNAHNALAVELRRGRPGATWARLDQLLAELPSDRSVALSGESFAGCDPQALREALAGHDVTIIWYVREFANIVVSQYAHSTKIGLSTRDFDAFFNRSLKRTNYNLFDHFCGWNKTFGENAIKVRMLDSRVLARGDVRFDILGALGVDVSAVDESELEMTKSVNEGLGWKTVEILRDLNSTLTELYAEDEDEDFLKQARKSRHQRQGSPLLDFTAAMSAPAARIGTTMGFTDKGRYLTREQFERCNQAFNAQVDRLRETSMQLSLTYASENGFAPRAFMPSVDEIPSQEVAEFVRRLAPLGWWKLLSGGRRAEFDHPDDDDA